MKCTQDESAQSLLEFMNMASDAVKCALKKPTTFKANINHRRYLQRQVKSVVRRRSARKERACDLREDVQDLVREAIKELKFAQNYANAFANDPAFHHHNRKGQPPQAIRANFQDTRNTTPTYRLSHFPPQKPHNAPLLDPPPSESFLYAEATSFNTEEDEYFMTGEELTNSIDINDLYIPELHEPRSPVVKCEDYFLENELEIPSPLYNVVEPRNLYFQFEDTNREPLSLRF